MIRTISSFGVGFKGTSYKMHAIKLLTIDKKLISSANLDLIMNGLQRVFARNSRENFEKARLTHQYGTIGEHLSDGCLVRRSNAPSADGQFVCHSGKLGHRPQDTTAVGSVNSIICTEDAATAAFRNTSKASASALLIRAVDSITLASPVNSGDSNYALESPINSGNSRKTLGRTSASLVHSGDIIKTKTAKPKA